MRTISVEEAAILYSMQESRFRAIRKITSDPFDFGDEASIGCCVKSIDWIANQQFGKFVGKLSGGYTIVVYDLLRKTLGGQQFDTLEEMHSIWQVD